MADINKIQDALGDIAVGKILYDEHMSRYASLLVGGKADALVFIENEDQLIQIVRRLKEKKIDLVINIPKNTANANATTALALTIQPALCEADSAAAFTSANRFSRQTMNSSTLEFTSFILSFPSRE